MTQFRNLSAAALVTAALAAAAPALAAQSLTAGGMEGVVRDTTGAPVAGALVTVGPADGSAPATVTTDPGGAFVVRLLPPGSYDVLVERIGIQPRRVTGIPVEPGALARVEVPVAASTGAAVRVESTPYPAGTRAGFGPPDRLRLDAGDLATLPADGRDLAAAARFSSLFPSLSPLDPASRALWVDGVRFAQVRLPGGVRDPLGASAFAFRWLERAELATSPGDVEWWGGSGAYLHAFTRRGTKDVSASAEGVWTGSSLGAADGFPSASVNGSGMEGGALVSGSLGGSSGGGFALGAEVRRIDTPLQLGTRGGDFASELAAVALDSFGVTLRSAPEVVRTELASGFGRVDAPLGGGSTLSITAAGSTLLSPEVLPTAFLGGGGGSARGSDAFVAATVSSRVSDEVGLEVRASGSSSTRTFTAGDTAAGVALTRVLSGALGFGANESFPGRFARTEAGGTATLFFHAGPHLVKAGGGAALVHHDRAYAPASAGLFTFSDADAFAQGRGTFTQTLGARTAAAFSVPRISGFVQDTWTPASGVEVAAGLRYDIERYPSSDVSLDTAWALRSGMLTASVPRTGGVFQPRASLSVDPGGRHEWLLRAEGGIFAGESDAGLLAEVVGSQSALRTRRGLDVPWARSQAVDSTAAVRTLSVLNPGWAPPRTARAMASVSRALPGALALHLSGGWSRSEFIPRRADLNRLPDPLTEDQHGRPLYGVLVQRGSLLVAQPGSGRRFSDFEQVSALNVDGWLEWMGVTVEAERRPAAGLRLLASYTYSRTRDNLLWAQGSAPGDVPSPFAGDAQLGGWDEGRSGFDVPHRAVAMAEWRGAGARMPAVALVYRFRSGDPFTAGFRQGVDANGDGSADNDPAFLDAAVSGFSGLASSWACLSGGEGAFAVRNACRGPAVHALDVRVGADVLRTGAHGARLNVDALNLLGGDNGPLDNAVYLVDPTRSLGTDTEGRVIVPLVANPDFGKPLLRRGSGRTLRISLQLAY